MTEKETQLSQEPHGHAPRRYQIYRQSKNGCHHPHGDGIDSPQDAVALFLAATPVFDGGGLHLWDHHEQRAVVSAEWNGETTRMGFFVRTRSNAFHDEPLAVIARDIAQREALVQAIATELRVSA